MSEPKQIRDISLLHPHARQLCGLWLSRCGARGVAVLVYETLRTEARQKWLYESGRTRTGLIVTQTLKSDHMTGLAWDAAPCFFDGSRVKVIWDPFLPGAKQDFIQTGQIRKLSRPHRVMAQEAEGLGIKWGGRWRSLDTPHFYCQIETGPEV